MFDFFGAIWDFSPGLAVLFVLAMGSFIAQTVFFVSKAVQGVVGSSRQVRTWLRDSGRLTPSGGATPDLGTESPALVNLLLTRGRGTRAAAWATVLDLAARGAVSLHQPGNDPAATVVTATIEPAGVLLPYERRVFDGVRGLGRGARLTTLPFLAPSGARAWHRAFRREVQAEAKERGLTFLDTSILNKAVASTFVPCTVICGLGGLGPIIVIFYIVATVVFGNRSRVWLTERGRDALGRWMGVRTWLEAHEVFADLPPASVAVWGRYLGYGAAMDVVRPVRV